MARTPQGYTKSLAIFSQVLKQQLDEILLPPGAHMVQYVDNILICTRTEPECRQATVILLECLARNNHKVSVKKMQYVQEQVTYLGYVLSKEGRAISPDRVTLIQRIPPPETYKELRRVLGILSYCRHWISEFSAIARPLLECLKGEKDNVPFQCTEEMRLSLRALKDSLCSAPVLGTPNYEKPFVLFVHEQSGCALSVLTQEHGGRQRPCAFFSNTLDPVAKGLPSCMRAVAAAAAAVKQSAGIVLGHALTVRVPHAVEVLLNRTQTQHLTAARLTQYELLLLAAHVTLERCNTLNPATLLPIPGADVEQNHDCLIKTDEQVKGRIDLKDQPLEGAEGTLFCDGSCYKLGDGTTVAGYAVCTEDSVVETGRVPELSAQAAELHALIAALRLSEGKVVNIFLDSAYAHGLAFGFGKLWRERGFMTAQGGKVKHFLLVNDVLNALTLPKQVAIVKCPAHKKVTDYIGEGNALADKSAKWAAVHGGLNCVYEGRVQMVAQEEKTVEEGVMDIQ